MALTKATHRMIEGASVNVRDFGAVGDGVTDDTVAIQAAIDSIGSNGGTVHLPAGVYLLAADGSGSITHTNTTYYPWSSGPVSGALKITSDRVKIQGEGEATELKISSAASSGRNFAILFYGTNDGSVMDLLINCDDTAGANNREGVAVVGYTDYTAGQKLRFSMSNCHIKDWDTNGLLVLNQSKVRITDNFFGTGGIAADIHFVDEFIFADNQVTSVREGLDLDKQVRRFQITGNTFDSGVSTGDGVIELNGSQYGTVAHNTIEGNDNNDSGIYINAKLAFGDQSFTAAESQTTNVTIDSNIIRNTNRGIYTGNTAEGSDTVLNDNSSCENITITNNIISSIQRASDEGRAIHLSGKRIICDNNLISDVDRGISLDAVGLESYSISGNILKDIKITGIHLDGNSTLRPITTGRIENNIVVSPNTANVSSSARFGIYVAELEYTNFSGNIVKDAANVDFGMKFTYNSTTSPNNLVISNNQSEGGTKGFDVGDPILDDIVFEGNIGTMADMEGGNYFPHKLLYNSAAPSTGTYIVGDIYYNTTPSAGGNIGWVCTTAGSPGTWKTFGTIAS
jgi:hypothetical protein